MNPGVYLAISTAENRRKMLLEEENMLQYSHDDLEKDWEFKIVRSNSNSFRRPEILNQVIQEESQAGWQLLEKLDDGRLRFKRLVSFRKRDNLLPPGLDPYRTQYKGSGVVIAAILIAILLALILGLFVLFLI